MPVLVDIWAPCRALVLVFEAAAQNLEPELRLGISGIGASNKPRSLGSIVLENMIAGGFEGEIWPVNPKYETLAGRRCHASVGDIPGVPDFAVIMTPAVTVPGLIGELGEKGTRAAVVITAGLTKENGLRQKMLDAARPHLLRIIGPNGIGLMLPSFACAVSRLNPATSWRWLGWSRTVRSPSLTAALVVPDACPP